ncbi:hypothetical protein HS125_19710 [bacterium]|nr:hypothetical protein [bacterium]
MGPASNSPAWWKRCGPERAEALAPGRPDITERLARAHELLGRHDSATQYRLLSARQWEEHGEAEAAERTYRAVLEREPAHAVAGQCLMDLLLDSGREAEAGELILACAERLADRGEVARAIEVVRRGLERVPEAALERRLAELGGAGAGADAAQAPLKLARAGGRRAEDGCDNLTGARARWRRRPTRRLPSRLSCWRRKVSWRRRAASMFLWPTARNTAWPGTRLWAGWRGRRRWASRRHCSCRGWRRRPARRPT